MGVVSNYIIEHVVHYAMGKITTSIEKVLHEKEVTFLEQQNKG